MCRTDERHGSHDGFWTNRSSTLITYRYKQPRTECLQTLGATLDNASEYRANGLTDLALLFSVYQSSTLLFFLSFTSLVSYFSLAPCTRLNWQFSVSVGLFKCTLIYSSSCRIVSYRTSPIVRQSISRMHCLLSLQTLAISVSSE